MRPIGMWLVLIALLVLSTPLQGEILRVDVQWRGLSCNLTCAQKLERRFLKIPGVSSVTLNAINQSAVLSWAPNQPFTFQAINLAMRSVGPTLDQLRVTVRGKILMQNNQFSIVSIGDNTSFLLLGPYAPPAGTVRQFLRKAYYPLSAQLQTILKEAARTGRVVIIEGQIFQGHRAPPLMLIIATVQFEQPRIR